MLEKLFEKHRNQKTKEEKYIYELDKFGYEEKYEDIYNMLWKETGKGFFETKKDIQVISAVIGFNLYSETPEKIKNYKLEKIKYLSPVNYSEYYYLAYSIAISLEDDIKEIFNLSDVVNIFNKCSALGMPKLKEILFSEGDTILGNFEEFIDNPEKFLEQIYDKDKKISESIENSNWFN